MKYLDRYIRTLNAEVEVVGDENKSDSKYYNINGFDIRLSNHRSPIEGIAKPKNLDIIQAYESELFIVYYKDTNQPMLKDRKALKTFIKNVYDIHCLTKHKDDAEKKFDKAKEKEKVKKICDNVKNAVYEAPKKMEWKPDRYKVEMIAQKHSTTLARHLESSKVLPYAGQLQSFKMLRKTSRSLFRQLYDESTLNAEDLLRAIADNAGSNDENNIAMCMQRYINLTKEE